MSDDQGHCWNELVTDFLKAEIEHGLASLSSGSDGSGAAERGRAIEDAQLTVELAKHFEGAIGNAEARQQIRDGACELERMAGPAGSSQRGQGASRTASFRLRRSA